MGDIIMETYYIIEIGDGGYYCGTTLEGFEQYTVIHTENNGLDAWNWMKNNL